MLLHPTPEPGAPLVLVGESASGEQRRVPVTFVSATTDLVGGARWLARAYHGMVLSCDPDELRLPTAQELLVLDWGNE